MFVDLEKAYGINFVNREVDFQQTYFRCPSCQLIPDFALARRNHTRIFQERNNPANITWISANAPRKRLRREWHITLSDHHQRVQRNGKFSVHGFPNCIHSKHIMYLCLIQV